MGKLFVKIMVQFEKGMTSGLKTKKALAFSLLQVLYSVQIHDEKG